MGPHYFCQPQRAAAVAGKMFSNEKLLKELYFDKFYDASKKSLEFQGEMKCNATDLTWDQMSKWSQSSIWPCRYYLTSVHYFISSDGCVIYSWYHEESPLEGSPEPSRRILIRSLWSFLLKKMKIFRTGVTWVTPGLLDEQICGLLDEWRVQDDKSDIQSASSWCSTGFYGWGAWERSWVATTVKWGTISAFISIRGGVRRI